MTQTTKQPVVALLGNPNSGKSSLFNFLTGLSQKVSNFPGVTVDKKSGTLKSGDQSITIIDFPGTYSMFPNSLDERIVTHTLTNPADENYPDLAVYVADATQLERHLLLASQVHDLGIPMVIVLNMADLIDKSETEIDTDRIASFFNCRVISVSVREGRNTDAVIQAIQEELKSNVVPEAKMLFTMNRSEQSVSDQVNAIVPCRSSYHAKLLAHHYKWLDFINDDQKSRIEKIVTTNEFVDLSGQVRETMCRFDMHENLIRKAVRKPITGKATRTERIDNIVTHRIFGPIIFFAVMLFVFQAIFAWASYPMDWIEEAFAVSGAWAGRMLGDNWFSDLLVNGVIAGLGGILVFVPQIAILFLLITILEESGYMSRVVFMFDSIMQQFGMNGRSVVSLISSGACAIPAIMATRTISDKKERLITILVSPLISCSARLPIYAVLIGFVVPNIRIGIFQAQGLALMGLYMLGIIGVFVVALVLKFVLKGEASSYLMLELPDYKKPLWGNVMFTVMKKVQSFVVGAGKIIMAISIVLWFLASFGPGDEMQQAEATAAKISIESNMEDDERDNHIAAARLESSYIGHLGKWIEPAIRPLGYDWKMGIALLTSFAAREVFVGTMATIYSIGSESDEMTIREKMASEVHPGTDIKVYNSATSLSLLVFYVFAMQCMSTLAVVRRETLSWKWPLIQFLFMGAMAYFGALLVYQLMS